jgi:hypothetical protein
MTAACLAFALLASVVLSNAQDNSKLEDFTKSPTEHIIVQLDRPFVVRTVKGIISHREGAQEPLPDALVEIEGPGDVRTIKHATTDKHGRFKIGHVAAGTYRFKTTLDGFQSVMGTIIVSEKAKKQADIRIEVPVGV